MSIKTVDQQIVATPGTCGGKPRIAGRRITVQNIVIWHERMGMSADEIAAEFELELGDIHAALAYYFYNQQEIDRSIRESDEWVDELRRNTPSVLKQKLAKLQADG